MLQKIIRFLKALLFHIGCGMPKTPQNELDLRWSICSSCEFFDRDNSQCLQCGCNLSNKQKFMNKLAWLDQKCPVDKW